MKKTTHKLVFFIAVFGLLLPTISLVVNQGQTTVYADNLCVTERCLAAEAAEAAARQKAREAAEQKGTYQGEVNRLAAEVAAIQAEIDKNSEEIAQLTVQIEAAEAKLASLKILLTKTITKLYLENETTPLEILASAKSIGDYTNRQAQQDSMKKKVKTIADDVKKTQEELERKRKEAEVMREANQVRRDDVAAKQAAQTTLMLTWAGREAEFESQAQDNKRIKDEERRARQDYLDSRTGGGIPSAGDPNKGGYPYANECPWNLDAHETGTGWGLVCECVSYTGWKFYEYSGYSPSYWGNANMWPGSARSRGFTVSETPRVNSVAVMMGGAYGHVAWVEAINGDKLYISQYNYLINGQWGEYSEMWISASAFDLYIYP
jgi:peptidoglycan hydrolase CwlO-like protein